MGVRILGVSLLAALALPVGAQAAAPPDPLAELDAMSRASATIAPGMALARGQIANGELLGALATLERVLTYHPESDEALLLHASLTCRVDDRGGALIEFEALDPDRVGDARWREATASCHTVRR
ncbi:MAG TPA: hypothetical protein VHG29_13925 [Novosphingobium sp.]|nr:hypothetical protein [Novosphingobium sp.]